MVYYLQSLWAGGFHMAHGITITPEIEKVEDIWEKKALSSISPTRYYA